jgi:hypothetical protein
MCARIAAARPRSPEQETLLSRDSPLESKDQRRSIEEPIHKRSGVESMRHISSSSENEGACDGARNRET